MVSKHVIFIPSNFHRQNHHVLSLDMQASLHDVWDVVEEDLGENIFIVEDKFGAEENRIWIIPYHTIG